MRLSVDRGITAKTCGNFASKPRPRQAEKPRFCRDLMGAILSRGTVHVFLITYHEYLVKQINGFEL